MKFFTAAVFQNLLYWKQTHDLYIEIRACEHPKTQTKTS